MGFYIQGQWEFLTASISNSTPTNVTMSLNAQTNSPQTCKIFTDVDLYFTFNKTATSTNSMRIPASGSITIEPLLTDKISFLGVSTTGNVYVSYFVNKQIDVTPGF